MTRIAAFYHSVYSGEDVWSATSRKIGGLATAIPGMGKYHSLIPSFINTITTGVR